MALSTVPLEYFRSRHALRLTLALAASMVVHAMLVMGIRARPADLSGHTSGAPLIARIEPAPAPQPSPEPTVAPPAQEPPARSEPPAETTTVAKEPEAIRPPGPVAIESAPREPAAAPAPLEVPVAQDPNFYPAKMLDEYPRPLDAVEPRYPARAAADKVGGKVQLLLLIDENGRLTEVSVVEASPSGYFEESAVQAFRDVRFAPGRKAGRAVRSRILINVAYEPEQPARSY